MATREPFIAWIKRYRWILGISGSTVSVLATYVATLLRDPLWTWMAFLVSATMVILFAVASFLIKEKVTSDILDERGTPIEVTRPILPWEFRVISAVALLGAAIIFGYLISHPLSLNALIIDELEVMHPQLGMLDGKTVYLGDLAEEAQLGQGRFFLSTGFYLKFLIHKAPRFKRVAIEKIEVVVDEVKRVSEIPKLSGIPQLMPFREHNLYLVQIDQPGASGNAFTCQHFYPWEGDQLKDAQECAARVLDGDNRESVVVRIEAKTPGLYKFRVRLNLTCDNKTDVITFGDETVLFPDYPVPDVNE